MDSVTRFFALYFTTLFSLDTVTAARSSPFSVNNSRIPDSMQRNRRDYGEGSTVGYRLDPGGSGSRRGGFHGSGAAPDIDIPANKNCPLNATPQIG